MKQIKLILYASLLLLLLLAVAAVKSIFTKPVVLHNVERIVQIKNDSIDYWRDRYGIEHAKMQTADAQLSTLHAAYGTLIDSVVYRLKINEKHLERITTVGVKSSSSVRLHVDTFKDSNNTRYQFNYADQWININGTIGLKDILTYTTFDSLVFTGYSRRTGFLRLGRKNVYIDAYSLNPHSKITGLKDIKILTERRKPLGLGVMVGYGWNGTTWSPFVGFGLQYSLIKF